MTTPPDVLTRVQVRDVDRRAIEDYGLIGLVLMENAGRNAASLLQQLGVNGPVVICCGKGNNAGDGFVIARHLENAGVDVKVLMAVPSSSLTGDAAVNFHVLQRAETSVIEPPVGDLKDFWSKELTPVDWVVDALLGTGVQGALREPFLSAIGAINASGKKVFAVDLPSGMDCDTGQPLGDCIRATNTATFVAARPGFFSHQGSQFTGQVHVLDIGVPRRLLTELNSRS